jgi:peptidoglycan hydrolase-like protein with peptidoglycan-binding domain
MNIHKFLIPALLVVFAMVATPAFAQVYSPNYSYYGNTYSSVDCTNLTQNLSFGSRSSEVSTLQRFLVAQNYPGGGYWMITGYYGSATTQAVKNFQLTHGLAQTGSVGYATRQAISNQTCGIGYNYNYNQGYNYSYNNNYTYTYPTYTTPVTTPYYYGGCAYSTYYNCQPQSSNISLSLLSPNSGGVGQSVTVYGQGFSAKGNTVHFGNGIISNLSSHNGTSLSFKVPTELVGYGNKPIQLTTYNVYVTNQQGQNSNTMPFTVTSLAQSGIRPSITSVTGPTSLNSGVQGTWSINVNAPGNTYVTVDVKWGDEYVYGYNTQQTSQSYYVSGSQLITFTHTYNTVGNYTVTFTASNNAGSNTSSASVNVAGSGNYGQVYLNAVEPLQGQKGIQVALQGSGFSATNNTVHFGVGGARNASSINGGTTIYYTIPHYVSPCDLVVGTCTAPVTQVSPGTYQIYVTNDFSSTDVRNFTVVQ